VAAMAVGMVVAAAMWCATAVAARPCPSASWRP